MSHVHSFLFLEEGFDDLESLLVEQLVLVGLELLEYVEPSTFLDHVADALGLAVPRGGSQDV